MWRHSQTCLFWCFDNRSPTGRNMLQEREGGEKKYDKSASTCFCFLCCPLDLRGTDKFALNWKMLSCLSAAATCLDGPGSWALGDPGHSSDTPLCIAALYLELHLPINRRGGIKGPSVWFAAKTILNLETLEVKGAIKYSIRSLDKSSLNMVGEVVDGKVAYPRDMWVVKAFFCTPPFKSHRVFLGFHLLPLDGATCIATLPGIALLASSVD